MLRQLRWLVTLLCVAMAAYYLLVRDRKAPEGKAALMENADGAWRFRELR